MLVACVRVCGFVVFCVGDEVVKLLFFVFCVVFVMKSSYEYIFEVMLLLCFCCSLCVCDDVFSAMVGWLLLVFSGVLSFLFGVLWISPVASFILCGVKDWNSIDLLA